MSLNILLSGATGRMGREIEQLASADPALEIAARASSTGFFDPPQKLAGQTVLIDFSNPDLCAQSLEFSRLHGLPMVIGTTGLDDCLQRQVDASAVHVPICQAANFSVGVNLLLKLVADVAGALTASDFDVEISEIHHRRKVDAPSGTALALGRAVADARGRRHEDLAAFDRHATKSARPEGQIGYQAVRGGDVAGEHTVYFLGSGERLELAHRATDRVIFAKGALRAARWLVGRPPGLYSMADVLGVGRV
ncbi:MAG: 4-hydroxy-tetrahydrodipicolinate reductase [Wenzhouxiangellaceae bacterium]|nr:4-hydroxy-tetrahydrodipicolinate reductase [Wenzhouxiangellaceae bacterium]